MARPCLGCGEPCRVRRMTRQPLRDQCRQQPQFRVIRRKEALKTGLPQRVLPMPLIASNRKDPRFRPELAWWWSEVVEACIRYGYEIP